MTVPETSELDKAQKVEYNRGGHVAHITVRIDGRESFDAMVRASELAHKIGGSVSKLYSDVGGRGNVSGCERGGVHIEIGTLDDD